jgi:hypothetical protein
MHHFDTKYIFSILASVFVWISIVHADTAEYELSNVWLLPDVTHPWDDARPMAGTFIWTFDVGDFENGEGVFTSLDIPWWSENTDPELEANIEVESLEITMVGNYHDYGVDVTLQFETPFNAESGSPINYETSSFEIQRGVSYQGHIVSGALLRMETTCLADLDGSGSVDVVDLLQLIDYWGLPDGDLSGDDVTDVTDLLELISGWGVCP